MGGDYTRWTFDPAKDYAELFKQQGRVDLDGDWNEFVEIVHRRWRAETVDIVGRAVVPESTPDAFLIKPSGPSQFTIGIGRMYVDGLLAECHGLSPAIYDATLGELDGTVPIPFTAQPYYPKPRPLPSTLFPSVDLIYLDVWQREVSALQDPNIREKALGGPDTTTRMQTVWQVKILPNAGAHACDDDIASWDTLVAPSAGRLTTSTVVPAPSPTPCILSPTGGYRGLENRLYRVEVHVAGTVGGADRAKFKWSRDNGSVVSAVDSISAPGGPNSVLKLTSLGRDRVLRFQAGDWVEIVDDFIEFASNDFNGSNFVGTAGFLTKIVSPPDEANRTITVNPAVPVGLFDPTNTQRHTRVRRWDQRFTGGGSDVDPATGLIDVTAGPLDIEDGIQVSFSDDPAGGQLHVGDYWIFAARTADGSVELLPKAPPKGILHHYARLGFMSWAAGGIGTFSDCRQHWPPPFGKGDCTGCCTVTVGDGINSQGGFTDIQTAINSLGLAGGIVCLGRGVFVVPDTIHIDGTKRNVTVRGMGWATKLIFAPDAQAGSRVLFDVESTSHVTLESFFAVAQGAQSMVRIADSKFCVVRDTALINLNISAASGTSFLPGNSGAGAVAGRAIELAGICRDCEIERNTLIAAKGIVSSANVAAGATGAINGTIMDAAGAVVPAVNVTLTDTATGVSKSATSDAQGKFTFPSLPPGSYNISFGLSGLTSVPQAVTVGAGSTTNLAVTLTSATVLAASISSTSTGPSQSDVSEIVIRANIILALQASIFLLKTEDCDIIGNRLFGLSADMKKALGSGPLTRDTIDVFQQKVLVVLTDASAGIAFQAAAIVLLSGVRVTISENTVTGLIGVMAFFLVEGRIEDNQILALVALLLFNGLLIRASGNFIAGLLAGMMQAGLLLDFESNSNLWLGLNGLMFLPLTSFQKTFGPLFSTALENAGFASAGDTLFNNAGSTFEGQGASLRGLSLVALVKIHHEVFVTFLEGIVTAGNILSGDINISENSFEFCRQAGITWVSMPRGEALGNLLPPIHVVERNTLTVQGVGVRFRCPTGSFAGNTIQTPQPAFELACQSGMVQDNVITGTATKPNALGLIMLTVAGGGGSSFLVKGNRLRNGSGHGILIASNLVDLTIEDNVIQGMALNGITTSSGAIFLQTVRISGNDILNCQGGGPNTGFGTNGAIILPDVQLNLFVHGNRLTGNNGIGMYLNGHFAQGKDEPLLRLLVQDNSQDGNNTDPMVIAAGYAVQFTGNQCIEKFSTPLTRVLVSLTGHWIVVTGNTVLHNQTAGVSSLALHAYSSPSASAIATSNILNGPPEIHGPFPHLVTASNISM
jgi:Family of unknown function (DUF6519)/Carboxypeptidase regulatory-like domain/Right handed beta helix region